MEKMEIRIKDELGQIFTPSIISKLMAKLLLVSNPKNVLDPAVGAGALLKAVSDIDEGIPQMGFDIDSDWIEKLSSSGFKVLIKNFFDYEDQVDGIIMNPPYIRQEKLIENNNFGLDKQKLRDKLSDFNLSSQSNLYLYFFGKALLSLEENGVLVTIMPNTWLSSAYGKGIQNEILAEYTIEKIVHFDNNVFKDIDVDVSIFVIINSKPQKNKIKIFDVSSDLKDLDIDFIMNNSSNANVKLHEVLQKDIEIFGWFKYRETIDFAANNFVALSKELDVSRGTTTNSNVFFILEKNLPLVKNNENFFKPILNKALEVNGLTVDKSSLEKMIFSTNLSKSELPADVVAYIKQYEDMVLNKELPKTMFKKIVNKPNSWFTLSTNTDESIVLNYYIRNDVRFILNRSDVVIKDNFYKMVPKEKSRFKYYLGVLNSSFTKYFLEVSGRSYGSGLLKIQKFELDTVPIVPFEEIAEQDRKVVENLITKILDDSVKIEITLSKIDKILAKYYLRDEEDLEKFYQFYKTTKEKRKGGKND